MPVTRRAGFDVYWTQFGQGPSAALMIHCSLSHSGSWGLVASELSGALTMTAFDMPGHGRSAEWDSAAEIQAATAEIGLDFLREPTHVIGHSFGATVALRMAVMQPDLVKSLVLIEPVFFAAGLADRPDMRAAFEDQMRGFETAMDTGDLHAAAAAFLKVWGGGQDWDSLPEPEQARVAHQMHLVAAARGALHEDVGGMLRPGVLEAVDQPALLLEGSASAPIISAINTALAGRLPRSERAIVAGAGHMLPMTHPRQVGAEILRFLRQVKHRDGVKP